MNCVKILLLSPYSATSTHRLTEQARRFGGDGGSFRDEKRFSPTGSNPLHNFGEKKWRMSGTPDEH
nr:unnamed protein product [Digitaria exilis]